MRGRRGNVLDLFLILLLVFSLVSVIGRFGGGEGSRGEVTEGVVSVQVDSCDASLFECLSVGEALYLASGEYFGELEGIEVTPASVTLLEDGVFFVGTWDGDGPRRFVFSIRVAGRVREDVFYRAEHEALLSGLPVVLYGERAVIRGTVRVFEETKS